jgi:hypothetical protein
VRKLWVMLLLGAVVGMSGTPVLSQPQEIDDDIALLRTDLKATRATVIINTMQLNQKEMAAFWPVYREYQRELTQLGNEKEALIREYLAGLDQMDDQRTKELTAKALELEEKRIALMRKYLPEFNTVLPPKRIAKFFQVELQLNRLIDLQIASQIPLVR